MNKFNIGFNIKNAKEILSEIDNFMNNNNCREMELDLSKLNFIDASKIAILCSTKHFLMYEKGQLVLNLKDEHTRKTLLPFKLKNTILKIKEKENHEEHHQRNYR